MRYKSKRERALKFISEQIIPVIKNKTDINWNVLKGYLFTEFALNEQQANECITGFVAQNIIKIDKEGILTIPDTEIVDWLKKIKEKEKIINNEIKEVGL